MPGWLRWAKLTGGGLQARYESAFQYDPYLCQHFPEYGWDTVYGSCRLRGTMEFYDECQNRDARLAQTVRTPGYERDGVPAAT